MTERIDISDLITQLCDRLDLGPKENVAEINLIPHLVTATVYRLNENGHEYVDDVNGKLLPVQDARTIKVRS